MRTLRRPALAMGAEGEEPLPATREVLPQLRLSLNDICRAELTPSFEPMLPPTFVLALVGRLPLVLKLAPVGLWMLVTVQYALANADGPDVVAALNWVKEDENDEGER